MKLYAYVMTDDSGTAPCVDKGVFTLACCKPNIRRCAKEKDWIVGLAGEKLKQTSGIDNVGKIVFVAEVTRKLSWADYGKREEFEGRLDNMYYLDEQSNEFKRKMDVKQLHDNMQKDVENDVLISDHGNFQYFGRNAISCPKGFETIISERIRNGKGQQNHKVYPNEKYPLDYTMRFVDSLKMSKSYTQGAPHSGFNKGHSCQC